jgi:type III secretory pathway component EscT
LQGPVSSICAMVNKQVYQVIDFARRLPHFLKLSQNDQRYLLKNSWNEVLILTVAYLSVPVSIIVFLIDLLTIFDGFF